jgi:ABC-type uncharacterized transport system ATPase subunit
MLANMTYMIWMVKTMFGWRNQRMAAVKTDRILDQIILEAKDLTIQFGNIIANDQVDLKVVAGQVHAVLGENGAGKSTLMKMLYGVYVPNEGTLCMDGNPVVMHPPAQARAHGIRMVFQDFRLVPALTVLDNIALAITTKGTRYSAKLLREEIAKVANRYRIDVNPDAYIWQLDLGQRQRVEILKALLSPDTRIVIFDEPTSVLTPHEVEAFLDMIQALKKDGYGVLLITHKIAEVMAVADCVTVLRQGKVTYSATKSEGFTESHLVETMMGAMPMPSIKRKDEEHRECLLDVQGLTVSGDHGQVVLEDVSFSLHRGEIVGVAGISGNGQRELVETLFGLRPTHTGSIQMDGKDITNERPGTLLNMGLAFVSEDPVKESVIPGFTILEHMVLGGLPMTPKGFGVDWASTIRQLEQSDDVQRLKLAHPSRPASELSGGNIQRMVLSRALLRNPRVLLVSYPSRGLDIGTTKAVQQILSALADQGSTILLISEDLTELFELSDRLVVLADRKLFGPYRPLDTDMHTIGRVMLKGESA